MNNAKTGRDIFNKYAKLIGCFCFIVNYLPRVFQRFAWGIANIFDGSMSSMVRYAVLKSMVNTIGSSVYIARNVTIKNPSLLRIGSNVSIHTSCYIDAAGGCSIGSNVSIAHASSIITFDHTWGESSVPIKYNPITKSDVSIDDDVWIGCGVRIMSGVSIGSRSIVAAGAVVTKDLAPGALYAGIPAKLLKYIL